MNKKVLTKEIAKKHIAEESYDFNEFTEISEDAVTILSEVPDYETIELNGITFLPEKIAKEIAKGVTCDINLNGLTALSVTLAESLSISAASSLKLDGIEKISDSALQALANFKGSNLSMNGLRTLSETGAKALARYESLSLDGLSEISDKAIKILTKTKGGCIELSGLVSLSNVAAKAIIGSSPRWLDLNALTSLPDDISNSLTRFKGEIILLNGLTSLGENGAKALARFGGERIDLNGLTTLSDEAARALSECKTEKLSLNGLTTISNDALASLIKCNGSLSTESLTQDINYYRLLDMLKDSTFVEHIIKTCEKLGRLRVTGADKEVEDYNISGMRVTLSGDAFDTTLAAYREKLQNTNCQAYIEELHKPGFDIAIVPYKDQLEYVRNIQIWSPNLPVSNREIVKQLAAWHDKYGLDITRAGGVNIDAQLLRPPTKLKEWEKLAREINSINDDAVTADELANTNTIHLWWD